LEDSLPVLRVIAALPSTAEIAVDDTKDSHPLAALRMDRAAKLVDLGILTTLGRQLERGKVKRTLDDLDVAAAEAAVVVGPSGVNANISEDVNTTEVPAPPSELAVVSITSCGIDALTHSRITCISKPLLGNDEDEYV
jgi:hypothetical protein